MACIDLNNIGYLLIWQLSIYPYTVHYTLYIVHCISRLNITYDYVEYIDNNALCNKTWRRTYESNNNYIIMQYTLMQSSTSNLLDSRVLYVL